MSWAVSVFMIVCGVYFSLMVNPRLDFINLALIPLISYPGFPRPAVAGSSGRPLGSHYGEQPQEDRREGDGRELRKGQ